MDVQDKNSLRAFFRKKRQSISLKRRKAAQLLAKQDVSGVVSIHDYVLSYASFRDELCTESINQDLALEGKLVLPMVQGDQLRLFHVTDPSLQLVGNRWGIREPNPEMCEEIVPERVSLALVPALVFDKNHQRIGYGKGFYDRLLPSLSENALLYGIGFKEQFSSRPIPVERTDFPLTGVLLF